MTTVICDASPLIFLVKPNRLGLVQAVLGGEIHVLEPQGSMSNSQLSPHSTLPSSDPTTGGG